MIILYPAYSFETLSTDRTETEAAQLLASWAAAFHPALLEKYNELPRWESASVPPYEVSPFPVIIPPSCESYLEPNWFDHQQAGNAVHIRQLSERHAVADALLEHHGLTAHGFDDEFVADFYALGTTYFLVDILVRKLHYASLMDDAQLSSQMFDAIKSYRQNNRDDAVDHLRQAFEAVCTSKEYYYPATTYFLDLTLLTAKTSAETFRQLLKGRKYVNVFLSADLLQHLPNESPELFAVLKSGVADGKVQVIADARLAAGRNIYREKLGIEPTVFGSQTAALNPFLPQLLKLTGYKGVIHFAPLDGWKISSNGQSKMIWQGDDGTKMDALVRYPLDSATAVDFFTLAEQLGDSINSDHCPTAVFAQFPGAKSEWLDDLYRMNLYVSALGDFTPIEKYIENTPQCGGVRKIGLEEYPFPDRGITAGLNDVDDVQQMIQSATNIIHIFSRGTIPPSPTTGSRQTTPCLLINPFSFPRKMYVNVSQWKTLPPESDIIELTNEITVDGKTEKEILVNVPPAGYAVVGVENGERKVENEEKAKPTFISRLRHFLPYSSSPALPPPPLIYKQEDDIGKNVKRTVYVLANEFFEAKIDAATGMLRSLFTPDSRFNRLSQQVAFRFPKEIRKEDSRSETDPNRGYTVSAVDKIDIEHGALSSKVHINAHLVDTSGQTVANFTEIITVRRRGRILEFELTVNERETVPPASSQDSAFSWDSYFALRYAWNDTTLNMRGGLMNGVHGVDGYHNAGSKVYAPKFVDLRSETGKRGLTLFAGDCPFHRRFGDRQLDTILNISGKTRRNSRFGIGVDIRYPVPASLEFLTAEETFVFPVEKIPANPSAWFFLIEAKNVIALKWEILKETRTMPVSPAGIRVFLLETDGKRAHFAFHSFREPKRAAATDFYGEELKEFKTGGDCVLLDMHGHELLPLNIWF
ncbi:MAG: hypothetical protein LBN39_08070 [Planctomycetaceae bacterium]|jgi:alpha-mannosidase|nr:hypothetical protein [Planctomycetaceae bacterium]